MLFNALIFFVEQDIDKFKDLYLNNNDGQYKLIYKNEQNVINCVEFDKTYAA